MRNPLTRGASHIKGANSAESAASNFQVIGGPKSTLQALGEVLPLMTESEFFLMGKTPAFAHFVSEIEGLSWHVVHATTGLDSTPRPLLAVCLESAASIIEVVLDPTSSFARKCLAHWLRQGYAEVEISKDGKSIACSHCLPVRPLTTNLAIWPVQKGWPTDYRERMLDVVAHFEECASDRRDTVQIAVIEVPDDTAPPTLFRLLGRLVLRADPSSQRARASPLAGMFRRRVRH